MAADTRGRWRLPLGLADYSWAYLRRDLVAGLTVATVAVPQAIAYAAIAGLPPVYGLYTAIVMTALASLFGSSSRLINGPTNAISLVVFGAVTAPLDSDDRVRMACLLAVLVGLIQIVIALLRLGDLTRYVSESVVLGFMAGAGLLVALSQLHNLLGKKFVGTSDQHFLVRLWLTMTQGGPVNFTALGIGLGTLLLVYLLHKASRKFKVKLPELLLALVIVSAVVRLLDLGPSEGKVAAVEAGSAMLVPRLPPLDRLDWIQQLWGGSLAIALLGLVEALAIAKSLAARTREPLDYNRQCLAEGLANLGGGFFQCMPGSGSLTRSAINHFAGAASRLSGVFAAAAVAATLPLFAYLAPFIPKPALAGVLLWTAWRIVDRPRLWFCLRATRFDAGIALATAFAAVFISIEFSILIGTFLSFLFFVPRASRLHVSELVITPARAVRERQPDDAGCGKLVLSSLEGNLFFGAAPELEEHLRDLARRAKEGARVIVIRLKRARNPDMVCLELLQRFLVEVKAYKVTVLLSGVRPDFVQAMRNLRFERWLPTDQVYPEEPGPESSTLKAVRRAYELLGADTCATCPRKDEPGKAGDWSYVI
jgi:SulP family sulfate permease